MFLWYDLEKTTYPETHCFLLLGTLLFECLRCVFTTRLDELMQPLRRYKTSTIPRRLRIFWKKKTLIFHWKKSSWLRFIHTDIYSHLHTHTHLSVSPFLYSEAQISAVIWCSVHGDIATDEPCSKKSLSVLLVQEQQAS